MADWGSHRVSVGIVIRGNHESVLLGRRAQQPSLGLWALPSGYVEGGETLNQAAIREAKEEAGVDVALRGVVALRSTAKATNHNTYVVFVADVIGGRPTPDDQEFDALDWFDHARLTVGEGVTPVTRRMSLAALGDVGGGLTQRAYSRPSGEATDLYLAGGPEIS